MNSIISRIGALNALLILILGLLVFFISAFLFLGSEEVYNELTKNIYLAVLNRAVGGMIFGYAGLIALICFNVATDLITIREVKVKKLKTILIISSLVFLVAGITGGFVFVPPVQA